MSKATNTRYGNLLCDGEAQSEPRPAPQAPARLCDGERTDSYRIDEQLLIEDRGGRIATRVTWA